MSRLERETTLRKGPDAERATLLVAEDHEDTRSLLRFILQRAGYRVVEAVTGSEAVSLAEREHPDLILTDLHMPQVDGVEAIRRIRSVIELRDIPILAMSGDGRVGMELFLNIGQFGGGFIDYLAKPFNVETVLEQIDLILSRRKQKTANGA